MISLENDLDDLVIELLFLYHSLSSSYIMNCEGSLMLHPQPQ
jgi:hypothetical protein